MRNVKRSWADVGAVEDHESNEDIGSQRYVERPIRTQSEPQLAEDETFEFVYIQDIGKRSLESKDFQKNKESACITFGTVRRVLMEFLHDIEVLIGFENWN